MHQVIAKMNDFLLNSQRGDMMYGYMLFDVYHDRCLVNEKLRLLITFLKQLISSEFEKKLLLII